MLQLDPGRNAARDPVMDALHAALFVVAKKLGDLGGPAERVDEFGVVHGPIKHGVYASVNALCINGLFSSGTIATMPSEKPLHESMRRLLAAVRSATDIADFDFPKIAAALDVTPATMTNWKTRGISMEGAVAAEQKWGCSPSWVLYGKTPSARKPPDISSFKARPAPNESQWATLDALEDLPEHLRDERKQSILEEGKKWKAISDELVARARGNK